MKNLTLLLLLVGLVACSKNVAINVPTIISNSFKTDFPQATDAEWELEEDGTYEVEFEDNGKEFEATYDKDGVLIKLEEEILYDELPQAAKDDMRQRYINAEVEEVEKITMDKDIYYEVEVEVEIGNSEEHEYEVLYDEQGVFISEELEDDE